MLDWFPESDGYPGACVCIHCSYGVMIRKGSDHAAVSQSGFEGQAGTLRTHYVNRGEQKMTYTKPASLRGKPQKEKN